MTRSKTITLLGPTARGRFRFTLGVYEQQREQVNGHPHFLKRGQEDVAMWHTEDGWIVGEVSMMGESRGLLHNMCDAALPQDIHARCVWLINTITDWIPSPHIRCVQGDAHEELKALAAAELAEVNSGAEHVRISCPSSLVVRSDSGLEFDLAGIYDRRASALINGRASFVKRDEQSLMLWCRDSDSSVGTPREYGWVVTPSVQLHIGLLCSLDASSCPEQVCQKGAPRKHVRMKDQ